MSTDHHLFLPPSEAAKLRQTVWSLLQKTPDAILLQELAQLVHSEYKPVYAAAKQLVRKGLAERINIPQPAPTAKNPGRMKDKIAVKGIPPWSPSRKSSWT